MTLPVPLPRAPLPLEGGVASWYEHELGWATAAGPPVALLTGLRFDVLELPAGAGAAVLRRIGATGTGPVALVAGRMRFLVAAGGADELPGLLDWLEWGGVALELTALGSGGRMTAPEPPGAGGPRGPAGVRHRGGTREGRAGAEQGAAVWLRPPSRDARWSRCCRLSLISDTGPEAVPDMGTAVGMSPISFDSWTRRRRSATGPDCFVGYRPVRNVSRWPSRRLRGSRPERDRGR